MSLSRLSKEIISQVESVSGIPVILQEEPGLELMATVTMARGGVPAHVIRYRPSESPELDYLIAFQCGFIIRLFSTPQPSRFDLQGTDSGRQEVEKLLNNSLNSHIKASLGIQGIAGLRDQLFNGLMRQLRSIPVGLRVDSWIAERFPELIPQQQSAATRQLEENAAIFQARMRDVIPQKIFRASTGINAAFAAYWSSRLGQTLLALVYQSTGHFKTGESLLRHSQSIPDRSENDRRVIDAWAVELGIPGWCRWIPFGTAN